MVRVFDDFFEPASVERIVADVSESGLDAVVLFGNSVEYYTRSLSGRYLKDRIVSAGVNSNRIVTGNLLEQVALAHPDDRAGATAKAAALLEVAVARALLAEPIVGVTTKPRRSVLCLGVSAEGAVAAQRLLQLGYDVVIADRGEGAAEARHKSRMQVTWSYILGHPAATFVDGARLVDGHGWLGDYVITLGTSAGDATFEVGGVLLSRPDDPGWISELRDRFKVDVDEEGHARSIDPALHPAETVDPGIMVVPIRDSDSRTRDQVAAGDAAAMALVMRLSQPGVIHYRDVSAVDTELCGGCASCVRTCAFGACSIDENGVSHVDERRCRACGKCVVSCPVGARDIISSPHDYLTTAVRILAHAEVGPERVLGFLCSGCGYPAADAASATVAERGSGYPAGFLPVRIPCGGRLDTLYVLEAFKAGFDAVCVYRCREGHCHNLVGNLDMDRRINLLRAVLRSRGIDDARLRIVDISPFDGERFIESVEEVFTKARELDDTEEVVLS